tara:strand:+ start:90 stop:209 length:120 start_codon:yes stop_codon:yes gene_type:complete
LLTILLLSRRKQIVGNITNPNGKKKYGGNNKDVSKPRIK